MLYRARSGLRGGETTCFQLHLNCTDSTEKNGSIFSCPELGEEGVGYKCKAHIIELCSSIPLL